MGGLLYLVQNSSEQLLEAVKIEDILRNDEFQNPKEVKNRNYKKRFESSKSKPLSQSNPTGNRGCKRKKH